jgi:hypothetical protein
MKAIETKYLSPTNTKGARYTAFDLDGNRVTKPAKYNLDSYQNHERVATLLKMKMGWDGKTVSGATKNGYAFVFVEESDVHPLATFQDCGRAR